MTAASRIILLGETQNSHHMPPDAPGPGFSGPSGLHAPQTAIGTEECRAQSLLGPDVSQKLQGPLSVFDDFETISRSHGGDDKRDARRICGSDADTARSARLDCTLVRRP